MSRECPYRKEKPGKDAKKTAKVKGAVVEKEETRNPGESGKQGTTSSTSPTIPSTGVGEKGKDGGVEQLKREDPASELITEATSLLKSLRSMKTFRLKQVNVVGNEEKQELALLDGGATHPLRMARPERGVLQPITV